LPKRVNLGFAETGLLTCPGQEIFVLWLTLEDGWVRVGGRSFTNSVTWFFWLKNRTKEFLDPSIRALTR
jgi:hypothetical protein